MRCKFLIVVLLLATPMIGADVTGAILWTTGQFASVGKDLAAKMGEKKTGMGQLKEKDFNAIVFHREESGTAVNPKPAGPGERRGDRVEGGAKYMLSVGDVLYIPANTAHRVLVDSGKLLNVMVVKMEVQK